MKLSIEAKLGYRAALAVIIALAVSHFFHLDRSYWAVLTTLALISQSWGESLQKAYARFGMTILGCGLGYLLFLVVGHNHWLVLGCLLLGVFGLAYFFVISYAWAMFFIGIIVVFMFGFLGLWSIDLLWERIYETAIGCVIAALVTGLFMPVYSRQKFYQKLPEVLNSYKALMKSSFEMAAHHQASSIQDCHKNLNELFMQIKTLLREYNTAKFEMIILLQQRKNLALFLHKLEVSFHYLSSLVVALRILASKQIYCYFEPELHELWQHLQQLIDQVQQALNNNPVLVPDSWDDSSTRKSLQEKFIQATQQEKFSPDEMMHLVAVVYYSRMLDKTLAEMLGLWVQVK